jgi:protocatechuate 3,4-dioxygenase beta subunit
MEVEAASAPVVLAPGSVPQRVRLPLARRAARLDLSLDSAVAGDASFTGRLVDTAGAPVAYAEVRLPGVSRATLTSEAGRFRLEGVPPGTHQVTVTREGYATLTAQVPFAANRLVDHRLVLSPTP